MYVDYQLAFKICALDSLYSRRENINFKFVMKCKQHKINNSMFPLNTSTDTHNMRRREKYKVNMTHTQNIQNVHHTIDLMTMKINLKRRDKVALRGPR